MFLTWNFGPIFLSIALLNNEPPMIRQVTFSHGSLSLTGGNIPNFPGILTSTPSLHLTLAVGILGADLLVMYF